jgi:hypothetical protein
VSTRERCPRWRWRPAGRFAGSCKPEDLGAIAMVNGNNVHVGYQGGDGNDLTLTVVP